MADETTSATTQEHSAEQSESTDWRAKYEAMRTHSREWEKRAKASEDAVAELEKLREESAKAQAELDEMKAAAKRSADVASVAKAQGIPSEVVGMLNGADADELAEQAKRLLKLMPVHPTRTDDGGASNVTAKRTTAQQFADALVDIL